MNIENLQYFYEAANLKSISKAAEKSHISQSALSKQIQKLEENLGVKLIDRSNRGVELTEAGELVMKYAEKILHNYDRLEEEIKYLGNDINMVKINACCVLNPYIMTKTLYHMKKKLPKFHFNVNSNYCDKIEVAISEFNSDIGLVCKPPADKKVAIDVLAVDKVVLVAGQNFDIPDAIDFEDILKYQMVMLNANNGTNETVKKKLNLIGKSFADLKIVFTADSTESIKAAVVNGQGITFLPYLVVKQELDGNLLKEIDVNNLNMTYNLYLIHNVDANDKIKHVINEFKSIWKKAVK